ncbi:MAG: hypothetical protein A4E57_04423 [Syntrophorhabdaceae bacterium PtaU1.Bin034]|nr:MAG: hypothetical protein A4E57_04423 [Syntrophorhabdaceae bacterium PtaU1.Bin034]
MLSESYKEALAALQEQSKIATDMLLKLPARDKMDCQRLAKVHQRMSAMKQEVDHIYRVVEAAGNLTIPTLTEETLDKALEDDLKKLVADLRSNLRTK